MQFTIKIATYDPLNQTTFHSEQDQKSDRYDSISNNGYGLEKCLNDFNQLTHSHTPSLEMLSHLKILSITLSIRTPLFAFGTKMSHYHTKEII